MAEGTLTFETWKDVPGYEGYYQVSDQGRIRSLDRTVRDSRTGSKTISGRILAPGTANRPYLTVVLHLTGSRRTRTIHSVVAEAFLGPRPKGLNVCYLNGDGKDNRLTNICYDTQSRNIKDTVDQGTHRNTRKTHCKRGHLLSGYNLYTAPSNGSRVCRTCRGTVLKKDRVGVIRG